MDPTSPALDQWLQTVQQLKGSSRPRTNPQLMRHYAAVLEETLTDTAAAPDRICPDLHLLPSGVVGMAFGAACGRITAEKSAAVSVWISNQDKERSDTERAYAFRGLLRFSPPNAFGALHAMRSSPTKEQRERLASALSDVRAEEIASMFVDQKEYEIRKVVLLLLSALQEQKSDRRIRSAVLEGILPTVARLSLYKGPTGVDVHRYIVAVLRTLDEFSIKTMRESLSEITPDALSVLMAEQPTDAQPRSDRSIPVVPELPCSRTEPVLDPDPEKGLVIPASQAGQRGTETTEIVGDALAWFDANIQVLAHARDFYVAARSEAEAERRRREGLEHLVSELTPLSARLSAAESRIRDLEQHSAQSVQQIESLTAALSAARQDCEGEKQARRELELKLAESNEVFRRERDSLQRRIDVNAQARVQDFRLAITSILAPLVRDVPPPGSQQAAELGPGLLVCIDQIIRALSEQGVALRPSVGEQV